MSAVSDVILTASSRRVGWGIPASILLHVIVVVLLIALSGTRPLDVPQEHNVTVEIVRPSEVPAVAGEPEQQDEASAMPSSPPSTDRFGPAPVPLPVQPDDQPPVMVRASRMMSEATLADPRSRQAREGLRELAEADRSEQLCNIEAMDQLHAWRNDLQPDRVVAYAMAGTKLEENTILADGAAFRSKSLWYNLKFKCELTPDHAKVAAFEFLVGEAIPKGEWEERNLPSIH
ncbi:DUF930 domain-containing protein [Mesorhizobium sp. DCY119]|uniref:DUF930 domain-containing protein n=1 Tax=Mesorhizobium sp. DCY119 TaxID=2108445 RepID=UPI001FDFD0A5|nr:DUF930 domain-containing protein [Mesorhizobium sp. DCY119]